MYVIMVYDVNVDRVAKVLKVARKYLNWVQNSVLEGEITSSKFEKLKMEIKGKIKEEEDSVVFYILPTTKYLKHHIMGKEKGGDERFL